MRRSPRSLTPLALACVLACSGNEANQDPGTDSADAASGSTGSDSSDPTTGTTTDPSTTSTTTGDPSTSSSSTTSTTGDDGSAYGPCRECQPPNMCAGISANGGTFCAPPCSMPGGTDCPSGPSGGATAVCALQGGGGNFCGLICDTPGGPANCPTGMCCEDVMQMGLGICTWGLTCDGGGSDTGTSGGDTGTSGGDTGTSTSTSG